MTKKDCLLSYLVIILISNISFAEIIHRRDGLPDLKGTILSGGEAGLLVNVDTDNATPSITTIRLPWSTVAHIESEEPRPQLQRFIDEGKQLWRAKKRLLRGDIILSEQIFYDQFNRLAGIDGEDSRLAAEGLLRVLLAQGKISKAVHPWLEIVRLHENGFLTQFPSLQPILDVDTMLCPHLPIFHIETDKLLLESYVNNTNAIVSSLCTVLLTDFETHPTEVLVQRVNDPAFLSEILRITSGDTALELQSTKYREKSLFWKHIWRQYAFALQALNDETLNQRKRGLMYLASVASVDRTIQPWLSAAAMIQLSYELETDGRLEQARRIYLEANRLYPTHPYVVETIEQKRINSP